MLESTVGVFVCTAGRLYDAIKTDEFADDDSHVLFLHNGQALQPLRAPVNMIFAPCGSVTWMSHPL